MRHRCLALVAYLVIVLALTASSASAKELRAATICGAERCVDVAPEDLSIDLVEGAYHAAPEAAEPWYRVRLTIGGGGAHDRFARIVLPRGGYAVDASGSDWVGLSDGTMALYRRLTANLEPFAASALAAKLPEPTLDSAAAHAPSESDPDGDNAPAVAGIAAAAILLLGLTLVLRRRSRDA